MKQENLFAIQNLCFLVGGFASQSIFCKYLQVFLPFCIIYCGFFEFMYVVKHFGDVLRSTEAFAPFATAGLGLVKVLTFDIRREKFNSLENRIKKLNEEVELENVMIIKDINNYDQTMAIAYLISAAFTGFSYLIRPLFNYIVLHKLLHREYVVEMPMKSEFFYNVHESPAYEITYFIFICATYTTVVMSVGVDSFFFGSCLNIATHFEILRSSVNDDTKKIVDSHQTLLSLTEELNEIFKPIVFMQFFISSMLLCVIGFQIVILDGFIERLVAYVFGLAIIIQLFIYAFGGQIIADSGSKVAENLYNTNRDLVLIIARSQKLATIKSGFYTANLPTFSTIMNSAASLITLLKSFVY